MRKGWDVGRGGGATASSVPAVSTRLVRRQVRCDVQGRCLGDLGGLVGEKGEGFRAGVVACLPQS